MRNWKDIHFLSEGSDKQQLCYSILQEYSILEILADYDPIVVGTIPIGIDIENSDIDIACYVCDFTSFQKLIQRYFASYVGFKDIKTEKNYVAGFEIDGILIEIYAESTPTQNQYGFRHMVIEYRILKLMPEKFRNIIIRLKNAGYKTEPAFGNLLGLKEPYSELLSLEKLNDEELKLYLDTINF